ncbi:MAG TPA: Bax inhibitor-1/YccA family protein [Polyangia bacterium]|nr:Bax inhibitor-1/YccA family protein [Polyangia bacterium]
MAMRAAFRSSNPALGAKSFGGFVGVGGGATAQARTGAMTIQGTVDKTAILLAVTTLVALLPWRLFFRTGDPELLFPWLALGSIGGFVVALATIFKKSWAPVTAPIYAACEGLALGSISALFEQRYPGIVVRSMALTFATLAVMLIAFRTKAIRATERFKLGVVAATGAIALVYLASAVLSLFGVHVGLWQSTGAVGIGISLVVVVVAALNLVLDFALIQDGAAQGAPKYMEWYGAFGLLVTLVWLYLEILRLLSKLNQRR